MRSMTMSGLAPSVALKCRAGSLAPKALSELMIATTIQTNAPRARKRPRRSCVDPERGHHQDLEVGRHPSKSDEGTDEHREGKHLAHQSQSLKGNDPTDSHKASAPVDHKLAVARQILRQDDQDEAAKRQASRQEQFCRQVATEDHSRSDRHGLARNH